MGKKWTIISKLNNGMNNYVEVCAWELDMIVKDSETIYIKENLVYEIMVINLVGKIHYLKYHLLLN